MLRNVVCYVSLLLAAAGAFADEAAQVKTPAREAAPEAPVTQAGKKSEEKPEEKSGDIKIADATAQGDAKAMSGMSILGNQEAPKSLVIVPWKSSQIGDMAGLTRVLDDSTQPVDREVFTRELAYYEIRSK
jgi:hypothetical protein